GDDPLRGPPAVRRVLRERRDAGDPDQVLVGLDPFGGAVVEVSLERLRGGGVSGRGRRGGHRPMVAADGRSLRGTPTARESIDPGTSARGRCLARGPPAQAGEGVGAGAAPGVGWFGPTMTGGVSQMLRFGGRSLNRDSKPSLSTVSSATSFSARAVSLS